MSYPKNFVSHRLILENTIIETTWDQQLRVHFKPALASFEHTFFLCAIRYTNICHKFKDIANNTQDD